MADNETKVDYLGSRYEERHAFYEDIIEHPTGDSTWWDRLEAARRRCDWEAVEQLWKEPDSSRGFVERLRQWPNRQEKKHEK